MNVDSTGSVYLASLERGLCKLVRKYLRYSNVVRHYYLKCLTSLPLSAKVMLAGGCAGGTAQVARRLEPTPYQDRSDTSFGRHSGGSATKT